MNATTPRQLSSEQLSWLWLLIGVVLLPFTAYQGVIALAAWLAPVFLLRFVRTSPRGRLALILVFLAYAAAAILGGRGTSGTGLSLVWGLVGSPIVRGVLFLLPYAADRIIGRRLGTWTRLFVFPTAFVGVDWLLSLANATGTFGSPAYSQYGDLVLLQIISVTGMWGITFLIAWFASAVNAAWEHDGDWDAALRPLGAFALTLGVVLLFGTLRLSTPTAPSSTVRVATVTADSALVDAATANIDFATFYRSTDAQRAAFRSKFTPTVDAMLARTAIALRDGAKLVAWQEDAVWVLEEDRQATIERAAALAKQYGAYLDITLGVVTRAHDLQYLRNQSILLDPSGAVVWTYDKTHPVFPNEALLNLPGSQTLPILDTPYGRLSTAICNDMGYPELEHQAGANGVDILFAPTHSAFTVWDTNDAAEATYRSVENGFAMVRATGNGPTLITDPEGRILASQDYAGSGAILSASVPTHGVTTIYGRFGDWFAYLCVLVVGALTAYAFASGRQPLRVGHFQTA